MNFKSLILVLVFACLAFAQQQKLVIDTFEVDTGTLIIIIDSQQLPQTLTNSTRDELILGGERDLILTAVSGRDNQVLTSGVATSAWSVSTPNDVSGLAQIQYDGFDNSPILNPTGLGNFDLTANQANSFSFLIQSDLATEYTVGIYTATGNRFFTIEVEGGDVPNEYIVPFSSFNQTGDFSQVGAITLELAAFTNVDALVIFFATFGPNTTVPVPPPPPPVPAPSRTPEPEVEWYTFDDDDEGRSPCGDEPDRVTYFLEDNDVVYYYFYGFDPVVEFSSVSSAPLLVTGMLTFFALINLF